MKITTDITEILQKHVVLSLESLDRVYLNVIQPRLQIETNAASFFLSHRGTFFVKEMPQMTRNFVAQIEAFADQKKVPLVLFEKKSVQRKEERAAACIDKQPTQDCVFLIGKGQEKARVPRVTSLISNTSGRKLPWLKKQSAMVNYYYFYCWDTDFGIFFIKFCSYFPYNAKLCLNGHEYCKRQLEKEGIAYESLDNGIRSCADPKRLQEIADGLTGEKIQALWDKWHALLPNPYLTKDQAAGFRYELFLQQTEFAYTQVFDRPQSGRIFFEQMLRDNLDLGRPDKMTLIFDKRIPRSTKTQFRTRLITEHVTPSLWLDYKSSSIKQYFKEGRALRTELTVNNTRDFRIGKALKNLPALREVAFAANQRLLSVQQLSHDPTIGDDEFQELTTPQVVGTQRVSGLRFGNETILAVMTALLMFRHVPEGLTAGSLREVMARLLSVSPSTLKGGRTSYQLRRLRLRGLIDRVAGTNRYEVTQSGQRVALFYVLSMSRVIRPLSTELDSHPSLRVLLRKIACFFASAKT